MELCYQKYNWFFKIPNDVIFSILFQAITLTSILALANAGLLLGGGLGYGGIELATGGLGSGGGYGYGRYYARAAVNYYVSLNKSVIDQKCSMYKNILKYKIFVGFF